MLVFIACVTFWEAVGHQECDLINYAAPFLKWDFDGQKPQRMTFVWAAGYPAESVLFGDVTLQRRSDDYRLRLIGVKQDDQDLRYDHQM